VKDACRVFNFSAGPATLPLPVLEEAKRSLISVPGVGASALEVSHRTPWFEGVIGEAEDNIRNLLQVPADYGVLFAQGGASLQFSMVPMNLAWGEAGGAYVVTGSWGEKAAAEAARLGEASIEWSGKDDGYTRVPETTELRPDLGRDAAYVHFTSNETIQGVQWQDEPALSGDAVLVCDCSSDFLSRPLEVGRYGLLYAGAQKNAGPAGVTVTVIRLDLLERIPDGLPKMLDYRTYAEHGSMYNTPPVFSIYVLMLVTRYLRDEVGGLEGQRQVNEQKAALLYEQIDSSGGFYRGHAAKGSRSRMNVTWRLPSGELERQFVAEAAENGLIELRGHRSVGGIRASIYNAMPVAGVETLALFMSEFAADRA
jgi:phosphoserine aminotransferase